MTNTTVFGGQTSSGLVLGPNDTATVLIGGTVIDTVVTGGGEFGGPEGRADLIVSGVASGTEINRSGRETVFGTDFGATVNSGGVQAVQQNGLAYDAVINAGGRQGVGIGGTVSGTVVHSGGEQSVDGGRSFFATVSSGGLMRLESGGTASGALIHGVQSITYLGIDLRGTVASGGVQNVVDSGMASGTRIESGGLQIVDSGGIASGTVLAGGTQVLSWHAFPESATPFTYAYTTSVLSGGTQSVTSGTYAYGTVVFGGGTMVVFSGGTSLYPTIGGSGALLEVQQGASVASGIAFSDPGARLEIDGTASPSFTVSSFEPGDTFDLSDVPFDSAGTAVLGSGNVLHISAGGISFDLQLDPNQDFTGYYFHLTADGDGSTIVSENTTPCFCRGTRIWTEAGEVPVEALAIGDRVVTESGMARPIKWVGRRAYEPRFVAANASVLPIRIAAGALAEGVPSRDLFVSPEHALVIDGLFLPARLLTNGATVRQTDCAARLDYFHIELDGHDVIFAEGAAAETFADFGGRAMFHNAAEFATLYPDAAPADWDRYRALLDKGMARLPAIRAQLLARAAVLGQIGRDPDLHLLVDGEIVRARSVENRVYRFTVPGGAREVAIASRSVVPSETEPEALDPRRLGVPFERAVLSGAGLKIEIGPDCAALAAGFHRDEGSHRWTDGCGLLPAGLLAPFAGACSIDVQIGATELHYPAGHAAAERPVPPGALVQAASSRAAQRR